MLNILYIYKKENLKITHKLRKVIQINCHLRLFFSRIFQNNMEVKRENISLV